MCNRRFSKPFRGVTLPDGKVCLAVLSIAVLTFPGFAKMYEVPKSFALTNRSLDQIDRRILPKIDIDRLLAEDRSSSKDAQRPAPRRFAVPAFVGYNMGNSGTSQDLPDGRLWRLRIQSPGAKSMNLGITRFDMTEGAKLWIYDPGHSHVEGPYTIRHRSHLGSLWTPMIEGDEIVVEVFVPAGAATPGIAITNVNQGYRGFAKDISGAGTEGTCNVDVVCPEGTPWENQIRAVGAYTVDGTATCTGTMMNNTALDFTPYFLSANHCGVNSTNDATVVVYWNYQSATCGTHGPGVLTDNQTGSTFRASSAPSDFLLLQLSSNPDPGFNVFYSGWDASGGIPASAVGIHHPSVDVKAISFDNNPLVSTDNGSSTSSAGANHWKVDWDLGVTEPGSSGSCLFDASNGRCVGQLHGGFSACGSSDMRDWYGKLSVSWTGGGTSATRLRDWLDPGNTGTVSLQGDPHITTADGTHYDLQGAGEFVSLRDANGLEVQTRQTPITTTFTPGADGYDGLAMCVSINTAVAARVGKHRVTYQPGEVAGTAAPNGLQLRIDGVPRTLGNIPLNLAGGGRVSKTAAPGGLQVDFPDKSTLLVTPNWWSSQGKWYLNVDLVRNSSAGGIGGADPDGKNGPYAGGIAAALAPGSWLPALPDGTSMGPMPPALHDRYISLYQKFANSWRVTNASSLFDYSPGTSTDTFTIKSWPVERGACIAPNSPPVQQLSREAAESACAEIKDKNTQRSCVFDVMNTGERGFAQAYILSEHVKASLGAVQNK